MESTNKYLTGMILATAAVAFGGFSFLRGAVKTYDQVDPDISYSMPRPKSALYTLLFGLEGREIQYKEKDPFKNQKQNAAAGKSSIRKDKKDVPKIDPKKIAKAATPFAAPKKPEVKVNVVNSAPADPSIASAGAAHPDSAGPGAVANAQAAVAAAAAQDAVRKNAETLSAAQWRALVLGQPTKENIAKLVEAFNRREVDVNTLYQIMNDLMQSSNTETQSAGLLLAQAIPSLKSFSVVAENYEKLSAPGKLAADVYFLTYMQTSRLPILALALKSSETVVAHRAAQVMVAGLASIKNPAGKADPRSGRGVVASGGTTSVYSQFIPILQQLIQGGDSSIAGLAQNALSQIQGLPNA